MDDLLGEDWQTSSKPTTKPPLQANTLSSNYSSFRPSPAPSSSTTPLSQNLSRPSSTVNGSAKPPAVDQFGSLLSFKSQKTSASNVSIQQRQQQILEERRRQQDQQSQLWDKLGSGRGTPEVGGASFVPPIAQQNEEDILAAFNKAAPVDNASHYPPPASAATSGRSTPAQTRGQPALASQFGSFDDDDDPFGLGSVPKPSNGHLKTKTRVSTDNDDILGDLAKPASEILPRQKPVETLPGLEDGSGHNVRTSHLSEDRRVMELVDMGFPEDTAKIALAETGGNVHSAVSWLLQQAHEESKQKAQIARGEGQERVRSPPASSRSPARRARGEQEITPTWSRQDGRSNPTVSRQEDRSPAGGDRDVSQTTQDLGSKFLKSANSLWKASQKQMSKTMAEFQQERDPSQPKWMQQDNSTDSSRSSSQRRTVEKITAREAEVTNEAALLDMPRDRPEKHPRPIASHQTADPPARTRTPVEPLSQRSAVQSRSMQQASSAQEKRPSTKLSQQEVEEQAAQAYISPARRKRPEAKPERHPEPEVDLFSPTQAKSSSPVPSSQPTISRPTQVTSRPKPSPSSAPRPKAPPRSIPNVSPTALSSSASHRKAGGEAFKRGDYASAQDAYTSALTPLPSNHPITIVVLSNRCLTALKTGDAKTAVSDADKAIAIIGSSLGVGESIDLGAGEGIKDMREFYGKALMRKAEALEHLEKWNDAASAWRLAIEAGAGGAISLRGRDRCEKAAAPRSTATAAQLAPARRPAVPLSNKAPPPAKGLGNSLQRPALTNIASDTAVKKLRAANAAAEKADDEKFALTDQVDARLTAWKGGKADNLRALLQSLDNVLWEAAAWKKVGMSDLVMPNKVKIIYMKAIAKVHPDKIPQDATTEQRMISAAVFSTLNEAWDKFKKDNNL